MGESDCMACTVERKQREVRGDADEPRIDVCPVHSTCRRCSECVGEDHHFMGPESFEDGVGFECKHCDYTTPAEECAECEELFPVVGVLIPSFPGL